MEGKRKGKEKGERGEKYRKGGLDISREEVGKRIIEMLE